ncbi:ribosomal protein L7/L12 [Kitasatospora sp. NPDC058115]|uniref:ribosomal protein L7/L12 n=1 Tax=Kitasatospora sp. NPDC058115 TaxID=3346347 RepID=UPI0036DEDE75
MEEPQFDAVLTRVGERRLAVLQVLRTRDGLSLREVRCLLDRAPVRIGQDCLGDVRRIADRLRAAGAEVALSCRECGRSAPGEGELIDPGPCAAATWPWCPASSSEPQCPWLETGSG